ncbi:uncharacterized protein LOC123443635 [Hordeum vulgare subsp. vulgare]|uniref:Predicted protein n=1 Tax=Hordeum vulgare subsp. vulgare TaxID=112509 RepID=F2DLF0_HORVV|nr:uncharacterized protein LOC123443635 [Hordeum vulgare subsp. vulgare]BAJ95921.1 predicted protein [Hordeum vulgare subsp. vulgare]
MTLTGPSPQAPGKTLGPVRWTRKQQRLNVVPFLKGLLGLCLESPMWQLEMVASPVFPARLARNRYCDVGCSIGRGVWGAMYPGIGVSKTMASLVPAGSCHSPANSPRHMGGRYVGPPTLEMWSSLEAPGNSSDKALRLRV